VVSIVYKIDANEPLAKEKLITPIIIISVQNTRSKLLLAEISPYPTVVMVVTAQ